MSYDTITLDTSKCDTNNCMYGWGDILKNDLFYIHNTVIDSHPGTFIDNDFKNVVEAKYKDFCDLVSSVSTFEHYRFTLYKYVSSFKDNHVNIWPNEEYRRKVVEWAGIFLKYDEFDDSFNVVFATSGYTSQLDHGSPRIKLLEIDGQTPRSYLEQFVFPYYGGIIGLSSSYSLTAEEIFIYRNNPYVNKPTRCTFDIEGAVKSIRLVWKKVDVGELNITMSKLRGDVGRIGSEFFMDGIAMWLTLPTFNPTTDEEIKDLHKLVDEIQVTPNLSAVVFDLRGNTGGSLNWGSMILGKIFGDDYVDYLETKVDSRCYWMPSYGNISYLENNVLPYIKKGFGEENENYVGTKKLVDKLKRYINKDELVASSQRNDNVTADKPEITRQRVFVVIDENCFSAALDFIDYLKKIPETLLIGKTTNVDTRYTSTRTLDLPSKIMTLQIPMCCVKDRERKDNQPYHPDFVFKGDIRNTYELKKFVETVIRKAI